MIKKKTYQRKALKWKYVMPRPYKKSRLRLLFSSRLKYCWYADNAKRKNINFKDKQNNNIYNLHQIPQVVSADAPICKMYEDQQVYLIEKVFVPCKN